ncbi:MAG: glucose-6-phosphate isomerase [Candidatus Melainabacteria bacterium]|jgi:glucose-6-phosphate isomerase
MTITLDSSLLTFDLNNLIDSQKAKLNSILANLDSRAADNNDWVGWLKLHENQNVFTEIQAFADETIQSKKFENLVIVGIGGSALGPQALTQALLHPLWNELSNEKRKNGLKIYFIDNVDPDWTSEILNHLDFSKTLFCIVTKSGATAETTSAFLWIRDKLIKTQGDSWKSHLIAITDPNKGSLRKFVESEKIQSFAVPSSVGGRFSVFSPVGMLPLALTGIKIEKFREGLIQAHKDLANNFANGQNNLNSNLAIQLAVSLVHAEKDLKRKINVLMPYSSHLARISDWYVQLVAESLGKTPAIGPTPIKAVGATDQHSQLQLFSEGPADKIIFFLKVAKFKDDFNIPSEIVEGFADLAGESMKRLIHAEGKGTAGAIAKKGVPSLTLELSEINEYNLAYLLFAFELMTAIAGDLYGIDPFNQPGVELSKKYTYALLGKKGFEQYLAEIG